jgi:hypothetical protein
MGANTFLKRAGSKGYKTTTTTATVLVHNIDPYSGGRIAVFAFSATCGSTVGNLVFMKVLGRTTVTTAVATGLTTVVFAAQPGPTGNLFASGDYVAIELNDGTTQYSYADNWDLSSLACVITTAFTSGVDAGAKVWNFGIYSDADHDAFVLTINNTTSNTKEVSGPGMFFAAAKGDPMRVHHLNASSQTGSINYISYGYIDA